VCGLCSGGAQPLAHGAEGGGIEGSAAVAGAEGAAEAEEVGAGGGERLDVLGAQRTGEAGEAAGGVRGFDEARELVRREQLGQAAARLGGGVEHDAHHVAVADGAAGEFEDLADAAQLVGGQDGDEGDRVVAQRAAERAQAGGGLGAAREDAELDDVGAVGGGGADGGGEGRRVERQVADGGGDGRPPAAQRGEDGALFVERDSAEGAWRGSLRSMMSAPRAAARRASWRLRTLASRSQPSPRPPSRGRG